MHYRLLFTLVLLLFFFRGHCQEDYLKYKQQWYAVKNEQNQVKKYIFFDDFEKNANLWNESENEFSKAASDPGKQHFTLLAKSASGAVFQLFRDSVFQPVTDNDAFNKDFLLEADLVNADKEDNYFGMAVQLVSSIPAVNEADITYAFLISDKGEAKILQLENTLRNPSFIKSPSSLKSKEVITATLSNFNEDVNHIKIKKEGNKITFTVNNIRVHTFKTDNILLQKWYFLATGKKKFAVDQLKWEAPNKYLQAKIDVSENEKKLLLTETFTDNLREWDFLNEAGVKKGITPFEGNYVYSIASMRTDKSMSHIDVNLNVDKDFLISCNTYWVSGNGTEMYGLQLGKDPRNKLFFMISGEGHVAIEMISDNVKRLLLPSDRELTRSFSPHINTFGFNFLAVERMETHSGSKVFLYINGNEIGSVPAEFFPDARSIGFVCTGLQTVYFDDLNVYGQALHTEGQVAEKKNTAVAMADSIESAFLKVNIDPRWRNRPSSMYTKVDNGLAFTMEAEDMEAQLSFPLSEKDYRLTNFILFLDTTAASSLSKAKTKAIDRLLFVSGKSDSPKNRDEQIKDLAIKEEAFTTTAGKQGILLYADYLHQWTGLKQFSACAVIPMKNKNLYGLAILELRGFNKNKQGDKDPHLFLTTEDRKAYWDLSRKIMQSLREK